MGIEDKLPKPVFPTIDIKELREKSERAKAVRESLRIARVYTTSEMDEIYRERSIAVAAVKRENESAAYEEAKRYRS